KYFQPTDRNSSEGSELYQEAIIAPFSKDQIQDCIEQYINSEHPPWKTEDYQLALEQVPNLQDLVKNPFLLRLALDVLPRLLGMNSDFSAARITRVELYDEFVHQWIERSHIRLMDVELSLRDKEAFKMFSDEGFYQHGISYLKDLATAIYDKQGGNPVISYSESHDRKTWKNDFFDNYDGKNLLRQAIPLVHSNDQYRFVHKSILEYGLSLAAYDPSARVGATQKEPGMSRRGSTSSVFSFEDTDSIDEPVTTTGQCLLDSPFGKKSFVHESSVMQFLGERAQQHPTFRNLLLATIELSKTEKVARIAAANSITVLVRSGGQFIEADLRGIKIPGADLSYGMFDSAQLDGADLRKAKLHNIWLRKASLEGADMTGAQFGELPFLQEDGIVEQCEYWHEGKTLAVGLRDGGFRLYDTSSWEKIKEFEPRDDQIGWPLISETSDRVAYYDPDNALGLLDVEAGGCFQTLEGHTDSVNSIVYSPCGSTAVSGGSDCTVRVWNVDTGECIHVLEGHSDIVYRVAYSPRGDQIASASYDTTVRLWNVETGECIHVLRGHSGGLCSVAYSPNGSQIASASEDGTARLWDVETGNCLHTLQSNDDAIAHAAYSPSGAQVALASYDKTVRLWDVETGDCINTFQGHSRSAMWVAYSPDGSQIASAGADNMVRLWTVGSNYFIHIAPGHSEDVFSVAYSPDGKQIASASTDKTIRLWDSETGNCVNTLKDHSDRVFGVAYSPKGDQIASGSGDTTVKLWDVETGRCVNTLMGHSEQVNVVEYSPNGVQLASGSDDHTARLWDVKTGDCIHILSGHTADVNWIAYSPKGDKLASASHDMTVRLWDVETGECICTLQGHEDIVFSVAYSSKGHQIASGSGDKTVRLWDIETGNCTHVLGGHIDSIGKVAYSPSSDLIASGGYDKTVRLWDVETGQCLTIISGFNGFVHGITWKVNENGQYLATGSCDTSVRRWEIIKEQDGYRVRLCWSSSHEALAVSDAFLGGVKGLSSMNQILLSQRGAYLTSPSSV
ncbi:hypothetical protein BGZ80_003269, partial [Entomortierella chlamydospora]